MEIILKILKSRFEKNMYRHKNLKWAEIQIRLETKSEKLRSIGEMERTGGEPDVGGKDLETGEYIFYDFCAESPKKRRNVCFDRKGQEVREKQGIHPEGNALDMAADMGIDLLTENEYRELQKFGEFDTKTSSWVKTPTEIRNLGGALFADRRFNHVFIYHNGASSFYAARGFRGMVRI